MLSVVIIARDAAESLSASLKSVRQLADEIVVVVDDRTCDETALLAKSFGAKVYIRKFDNFAGQKNYAAAKARGEWVLALDADERVSPRLADEIKRVLPNTDKTAFKIPRLNYIFGKPVYHTNWEPSADNHIWLWKKDYGRWVGAVHEEVVFEGKVGQLSGFKLHNSYKTVEEFMTKMNDYTSRETQATNPFFDFFRRYVWHAGWRDGWQGLFLSYLQAISHTAVWVKLWEKKKLPF